MVIDNTALSRLSVLQLIRRKGPIARVELAELLGLAKGTVTAITAELIESGLVSETVGPVGERGRPRVFLDIIADSFAVIGASLGSVGLLDISLVDLSGTLLESRSFRQIPQDSIADLIGWITDAVASFMADTRASQSKVACVAVAIPGIVESSAGVLHWLTSFPEEAFPAAAVMTARLGLPVILENNLDCLARAEHWFGEGEAAGDFTIVYQGLSVGLAQYASGLPRTGIENVNSEFGHTKTDFSDDARACFCGMRGCVTAYSSSLGAVSSQLASSAGGIPEIALVENAAAALLTAATAGDLAAMAVFASVGRHLGRALANYINSFAPRLVLIRTADSRMPALIDEALRAALAENTIPTLLRRTTIEVAVALADWQQKGTAALALEQAYLGRDGRKWREVENYRTLRNVPRALVSAKI